MRGQHRCISPSRVLLRLLPILLKITDRGFLSWRRLLLARFSDFECIFGRSALPSVVEPGFYSFSRWPSPAKDPYPLLFNRLDRLCHPTWNLFGNLCLILSPLIDRDRIPTSFSRIPLQCSLFQIFSVFFIFSFSLPKIRLLCTWEVPNEKQLSLERVASLFYLFLPLFRVVLLISPPLSRSQSKFSLLCSRLLLNSLTGIFVFSTTFPHLHGTAKWDRVFPSFSSSGNSSSSSIRIGFTTISGVVFFLPFPPSFELAYLTGLHFHLFRFFPHQYRNAASLVESLLSKSFPPPTDILISLFFQPEVGILIPPPLHDSGGVDVW